MKANCCIICGRPVAKSAEPIYYTPGGHAVYLDERKSCQETYETHGEPQPHVGPVQAA